MAPTAPGKTEKFDIGPLRGNFSPKQLRIREDTPRSCVEAQVSERLISLKEVTSLVPFTKVHIYLLMKRGEFPRSIKIGRRRVCWRESDVEAWIASKAAKSSEMETGR